MRGETKLARLATKIGLSAGVIVAIIGAGHLAAWFAGVMTQRGFSTVTMKTNTALCLLLLGLVLTLRVGRGRVQSWITRGVPHSRCLSAH